MNQKMTMKNRAGRTWIGAVYLMLRRLGERVLITVRRFDPRWTGPQPQVRIVLTEEGRRALQRAIAEGKQLRKLM